MNEPNQPERVLVVTAHPDDVDFGAAGSVATWTDEKIDVAYCVVTDGSAGSADPTVAVEELKQIRQREQLNAAAAVGVSEVHFLGYRDGSLEVSLALRRDIARIIRTFRPRARRLSVAGAQLGPDPGEPPGPPRRRRGDVTGGLSGHEKPLLVPGAVGGRSRTVRCRGGLAHGLASGESRRRHNLDHRSKARRLALPCQSAVRPEPARRDDPCLGAATAASLGLEAGRLAESFQVVDTR